MKELNKSKKSKKKLFVTLGLLFGLAGIGTAAFAGYVIADQNITQPDGPIVGDIDVTNNSVSLVATITDGSTLYFYPDTETTNGARLNYTAEEGKAAKRRITLEVAITDENSALQKKKITVAVTVADKSPEGEVTNAVAANYISLAEGEKNQEKAVTEAVSGKLPFTIDFDWGSKFGNTDPVTYYNGKKTEEVSTETMETELNAFRDSLADTSITIEVDIADATA